MHGTKCGNGKTVRITDDVDRAFYECTVTVLYIKVDVQATCSHNFFFFPVSIFFSSAVCVLHSEARAYYVLQLFFKHLAMRSL